MTRRGRPRRGEPSPTRDNILRAAENIIANASPDAVRLQDIAKEVGIRVPTIYSHFPAGRDGVLRAVGERYVEMFAAQFPYDDTPAKSLLEGTRKLVRAFAANPAFVKLSLADLGRADGVEFLVSASGGSASETLTKGPLADMYDRLDTLLADGCRAGDFRRFDAVRFLRQVMGSVLISLTWPSHAPLGRDAAAAKEVSRIERETLELVRRLVLQD